MALWEYKVITSGLHGFATPSLLEAHLNALGKDEWEIIHFQTLPNNPLAFNGLARRSTTRDWVPPEAAVVTAPKPSAWEPPASPAAKSTAHAAEEKPEVPPALIEADAPKTKVEDTKLRTVRDTERDQDPEALAEEDDDWDNWAEDEDELPTLFEAVKPHMRRNQRGPGMSVALDYLAKRWEQKESDIAGALKECGLTVPETEEADPEYFEFEGDLYWINRNNRNQLFLNTREKPRPTFRIAPVAKLDPNDPAAVELAAERAAEKAEIEKRNAERAERQAAQAAAAAARAAAREQAQAAAAAAQTAPATGENAVEGASTEGAPAVAPGSAEPLTTGEALLSKLHPHMRRNRRGPGYSGSITFLARALKTTDDDLIAGLAALNLHVPANPNDKPVYVEIGKGVYWINKDGRGGIWINGRERREGDRKAATTPSAEPSATAESPPSIGGETLATTDAAQETADAPAQPHVSMSGAVPAEVIVAAVTEAIATGELSKAEPASPEPSSAEVVTNGQAASQEEPDAPSKPADRLPASDAEVDGVATESGQSERLPAEPEASDEPAAEDAEPESDSKPAKAKKPSRSRGPRRPKKSKE